MNSARKGAHVASNGVGGSCSIRPSLSREPAKSSLVCDPIQTQTEPEEAQVLLGCIAEGDYSAFWNLWQKYQKHLFAVCLRQMGGMHADAEDALSRAMLVALDRLPRHARSVIHPRAWLTRLTCNVCVEMHREHKRRKGNLSAQSEAARNYQSGECLISSPEDDLLLDELLIFLSRIVDDLPSRLRKPFILRFELELPYQEVAEELRVSTDNVRKRIQQARAILRVELSKYLLCIISAPAEESAPLAVSRP